MNEYIRIVDGYKTVETTGYAQKTPVVHLFGRDTNWNRHHIRIDDFKPYFLVRLSEWMDLGEQLSQDDRVVGIETEDHRGRTETAIDGETLIRVLCRTPKELKQLRQLVDDPFEADIKFTTRFLIDVAYSQWISVDSNVLESQDGSNSNAEFSHTTSVRDIHVPDYEGEEESTPETIPPIRSCIYDIEVEQGGDGPPVVSKDGTEQANNDITAISAYDSYTMDYHAWILKHNEWDLEDVEAVRNVQESASVPLTTNAVHNCKLFTHIYDNPRDVVAQFCKWVKDRGIDSLVAWNGASFDHPYLVNYGLKNGVGAVKELSPTYSVYDMDGSGSFINSSLKGRLLLDLMVLYKKCKIHALDSYRLEDVANAEGVSVGKLSIEDEIDVPADQPAIDFAWKNHPEVFMSYSLKDVQACVGINNESQKNVSII